MGDLSTAFRTIDISKRVGSAGANRTHGIPHKRPFSYTRTDSWVLFPPRHYFRAGTNDPDFAVSNERARSFTCTLETCTYIKTLARFFPFHLHSTLFAVAVHLLPPEALLRLPTRKHLVWISFIADPPHLLRFCLTILFCASHNVKSDPSAHVFSFLSFSFYYLLYFRFLLLSVIVIELHWIYSCWLIKFNILNFSDIYLPAILLR